MRPTLAPHVWQSRIVTASDGLYRGADDASQPGEWAHCAMVHDDVGEAWGTVAWLHDRPQEWWLSRYPFYPEKGQPPLMGTAEIVFAADMEADLLLVETPARYVQLATIGPWNGPTAVVLNWERPDTVRLWLSLVKAVRCESESLRRAVESALGAKPAKQRLRIKLEAAASCKEVT